MSFERAVVDHFYIVRWNVPTAADADRILKEQAEQVRVCGRKLMFLVITPPESTPPDEAAREAFGRATAPMMDNCEHLYFALEGTGFGATIKRSALAAIFLVNPHRGRITVGDTVDRLVAKANEPTRSELKRAIRVGAAMGIRIDSLEVGSGQHAKFAQPNHRSASR